ncbi:FbpB family small basic protein [Halobacillus litoralis]|nr:FbpB family small basic protein [Halobacillus litoralis]MCA1023467.1 FbpB family small basic protein [Halobacillus litoralis]
MRSIHRLSFEELVDRNKQQLLQDEEAIEDIERQIDEKHTNKLRPGHYMN